MPLKSGKSKEAFNFNVEELVNSWKKKGKMGSSRPESLNKARKQALAIAFSKQRG
jgi:hypothetical protein